MVGPYSAFDTEGVCDCFGDRGMIGAVASGTELGR